MFDAGTMALPAIAYAAAESGTPMPRIITSQPSLIIMRVSVCRQKALLKVWRICVPIGKAHGSNYNPGCGFVLMQPLSNPLAH